MAKKRASLLNAFNAALPKRVDPPRVAPIEPVRSAEPRSEARADYALPVRAAPPAPVLVRRAGTHADLPAPPTPFARGRMLLLSIVGAVVLLIVVIVIKASANNGEESDSVAAAGVPGTATSAPKFATPKGEPVPAKSNKAALDTAVGLTDDDKAFNDARNKFTVRLVQYENDATGLRHARDTYKYLRTEGVPAVQPIQSGDGRNIYLCADAKPKKDDLAGLCAYIRRLRGSDRKSTPFSDAYVDNIEHLIQR